MMMKRREFLQAAGAGIGLLAAGRLATAAEMAPLRKSIPSSGETIPAIGMGSWVTFNVGSDQVALAQRTEVLRSFFRHGGGMIDSSPMYGSSEAVIGHCLRQLAPTPGLFSATKVWTSAGEKGPQEIEHSRKLWDIDRFDLLQVHNMLSWEAHLETLFAMQAQGRVRYVGITTSHGRRHGELEKIMRSQPIDFVQATYNLADREVEQRILPLAAERGIAFIANRPYQRGALIKHVKGQPLPQWAGEFGCSDWPCFLLKFIISHAAVTCAIPATSRVDHMAQNMAAMAGTQPDETARRHMITHLENL